MGKINVLDKHISELIAAGEVVERPCSVIKELVENCIDAGASAITVEIKNGGITYMRVTDNGCGISREDVSTAFVRHATSKVHSQDDLESISTLGFRGEALASIAAVSHVELITITEGEIVGTRYVIDGGEEQTCEDAGCAQGTTFVVRDLFYNTPARMKFLKKDITEANAIAAVMDRIALSHPEISIRFIRDSREALHTPGDGNLKSSIYEVYGKDFTLGLLSVSYELNGVNVNGFISKPTAARPNRSMQHFFINGRYVKSRTAMVALEQAFKGSVMVGKFPSCVLNIEISYRNVDVNVHPSKIEVRFIKEKPVFDAVYHGVKTALNKEDKPNTMSFEKPKQQKPVYSYFVQEKEPVQMKIDTSINDVKPPETFSAPMHNSKSMLTVCDSGAIKCDNNYETEKIEFQRPQPIHKQEEPVTQPFVKSNDSVDDIQFTPKASLNNQTPYKLIGEAFETYIIVEHGKDELIFIDKHAAHERMLYEKLKSQGGQAVQQMLLEPVTVTLEKNEYAAVLNAIDIYASAGFEIEDFGAGTVIVRSAPMILAGEDVAEAVMEIAGYLESSKNDITTEKLDWLYHNVACRAAIKAGDESSAQELIELIKRIESDDIRYCPHGRPVSIIVKRKDLERQFGRI
jgi:DNA mismatch repair protein MutL